MSKASEFANMKAPRPPRFVADDRRTIARVSDSGHLDLVIGILRADEALRLADWIKETFGENS